MKALFSISLSVAAFLFIGGCVHKPDRFQDQLSSCHVGLECRLTGRIDIDEVSHVRMGKMLFNNGSCINISMPKRLIEYYMFNPAVVTIEGVLRPGVGGDDVLFLIVGGRKVGLGGCGDVFLYVED